MKALFLAVLLATSGLTPPAPGCQPLQDQAGASEVAAPAFPVDTKRRWRMERSDALKNLELAEVVTDEGFIFYIQKAFKQPENYAQQVVDTHLPWLVAAEKAFDEVTGFGPGAKREPVAVVVLATSGDLANYLERAPLHCYAVNTTPYNPYLATLTLVNLRAKTKNSADVRTRLLIHSAVHALWQAHSHTIDEAPGDLWLKEGLADFIARSFGKTPTDVQLGIRLATIIDRVIPLCKVVPFSQRWLMTVKEFVEPAPNAPEAERLDKALWSLSREDCVRAFYGRQAEVDLFFRYLHSGKNGELRLGLRRFLATSLHGAGSLTKALERESLDGLAVDFWRSLFEEYKAATPDFNVETLRGPAEVAKAAELLGATAKVAVEAASPQAGLPRPTAPSPEPTEATIPAPVLDLQALHSEALWLASQGQLAPAIALLETEREARGGKLGEAAIRDLARLTELATVRQTYLSTVAAERGRLRHIAPLSGRVDVDLMELSYLDPVVLPTYRNSFVLIIFDDLALTYMYSFGHANILSRITRGAEERLDQDNPTTYMYEVPYRIHMTSDAKALTVEAEGAETLSMVAAAPARGYTSILFNCDAMGGVTQLVIEGDLDAAARRELALRYADGELAEMGLL